MHELIQAVLAGQYGASLAMLRGCIERADEAAWHASVGRFPVWHVAYHVLFYTDMYLSPDENSFRPQEFHREGYNFLGPPWWAPEMKVVTDRPFEKEMIVDYLDAVCGKAKQALDRETEATFAGPSGFEWLQFSRLEAHVYNIRHVQHHTGQLGAFLRRHQEGDAKGVEWVATAAL